MKRTEVTIPFDYDFHSWYEEILMLILISDQCVLLPFCIYNCVVHILTVNIRLNVLALALNVLQGKLRASWSNLSPIAMENN